MLRTLPITKVYPNPEQPRKLFDPRKLEELAASIREQGQLQPIRVRRDRGGRYMIIAGERRYRAHLLADLGSIEAVVVKADDDDLADQAIIENMQRADEIVIVKKINPYRAGILADQVKVIQFRLRDIEKTLRTTAVQMEFNQ